MTILLSIAEICKYLLYENKVGIYISQLHLAYVFLFILPELRLYVL